MAISPTIIPKILQSAGPLASSMTPALKIDNRSSSSSAANVSVAPVISVVTNGSSGDLSASGSASGSPVADNSSPAGFDYGGSLATPLYGGGGGSAVNDQDTGGLFGIDPLLLLAGAGLVLFLMTTGGKKGAKA